MDRLLRRRLAACGLGLILAATGCRGFSKRVPPEPPYPRDGAPSNPVGFNAAPPPAINPVPVGAGGDASPYGPSAAATPYDTSSPSNPLAGAPPVGVGVGGGAPGGAEAVAPTPTPPDVAAPGAGAPAPVEIPSAAGAPTADASFPDMAPIQSPPGSPGAGPGAAPGPVGGR